MQGVAARCVRVRVRVRGLMSMAPRARSHHVQGRWVHCIATHHARAPNKGTTIQSVIFLLQFVFQIIFTPFQKFLASELPLRLLCYSCTLSVLN
jgi:hypothetical protein